MADGTLKVGTITTSSGSGTITIGQSGETIAGIATNTPAFEAYLSNTQAATDNTDTKVAFDSEVFDSDSAYNTSTYKFSPTTAGKYCCYANVYGGNDGSSTLNYILLKFWKNGSQYQSSSVYKQDLRSNDGANAMVTMVQTIDFNGSSDYLEVYCKISTGSNPDIGQNSAFGAFKLIGV